MPFTLPPLSYNYSALEPAIDGLTMQIHHTKHHQAYVDKLNAALEGRAELAGRSIEELLSNLGTLPESIRLAVQNNGGGHYNHTLFWEIMGPPPAGGAGGDPGGELAAAIASAFGGFNEFKDQFTQAALGRFGSGWAWLALSPSAGGGQLVIYSTPNQDSPIMQGDRAVLGLDVWEHAYYLKYQNRRSDYVAAWWGAVNWNKVKEIYLNQLSS